MYLFKNWLSTNPENIEHEFGHVIDFRTYQNNNGKIDSVTTYLIGYDPSDVVKTPRNLVYGYKYQYKESRGYTKSIQSLEVNNAGEEWADNYMNYINNTFRNDKHGQQRRRAVAATIGKYR